MGIKFDDQPFEMSMPMYNLMRVSSPEHSEYILKTNFKNYVKTWPATRREMTYELLGDGIFNADGDVWQKHRKVASHMFSLRVLRDQMEKVFVDHAHVLIDRLKSPSPNNTVDMQDMFFRYTLDSFVKIAFGVELNGLKQEQKSSFAVAFDNLQELIFQRFFLPAPFFIIRKMFKLGSEAKIASYVSIIDGFVSEVVHQSRKLVEAGEHDGRDLISLFVAEATRRGESVSGKELRDIGINFILAGRDTTAALMTWSFYEFSQHPEMEARAIKEMEEQLGDETPNHENVERLTYLHAFLSEVLRLHPPVPADTKMCLSDDVLPGGWTIKKGMEVAYMPYSFGRSKKIWGEDALTFDPERWLRMDREPSQYAFITFNAGPRICLGKQMAYFEAKVLVSMLLQNLRIRVQPDYEPEYRTSLILQMKRGLPCTVSPLTE